MAEQRPLEQQTECLLQNTHGMMDLLSAGYLLGELTTL
jgi:hypothetical protein